MNPKNIVERLTFKNMGLVQMAADATLTDIEWDSSTVMADNRLVILQSGTFGDTGTGGLAAVSIHASDTVSDTPDSGNKVLELTGADIPAEGDDSTLWAFKLPATAARYITAIITASDGDTVQVGLLGVGVPFEGPASAADRGLDQYVTA